MSSSRKESTESGDSSRVREMILRMLLEKNIMPRKCSSYGICIDFRKQVSCSKCNGDLRNQIHRIYIWIKSIDKTIV